MFFPLSNPGWNPHKQNPVPGGAPQPQHPPGRSCLHFSHCSPGIFSAVPRIFVRKSIKLPFPWRVFHDFHRFLERNGKLESLSPKFQPSMEPNNLKNAQGWTSLMEGGFFQDGGVNLSERRLWMLLECLGMG